MLFNSYEFIFVFLPVTFAIYFYLNSKRLTEASKAFMVLSSLFFYSWWNITYLPVILVSMLLNYVVGISLSKDRQHTKVSKKTLLIFGIMANVSLLAYFKYADFIISNMNMVMATGRQIPLLGLALPLAISFFTFQQVAYLIDSYRGETKEYDFLNYANFVVFFPQLIAGPIVHHQEMMPQFANARNKVINFRNVAVGLFVFSIGLFKKVVIADSFAVWATQGFDVAETLNLFEAWATSLSYTFQLYFDFSGYTDMAVGTALLFNIKLPFNFNSPYKAINIQDFWRRWHITLSRFLRDYIYIPLGGNRKGNFRSYSNLMATFIIGGIWHGAGWTFVFWGALHGLALIIQRLWNQIGFNMNTLLSWLITFNFVNISWVFFRAKEWSDAIKVINGMLGFTQVGSFTSILYLNKTSDNIEYLLFIIITVISFYMLLMSKNSNEMSNSYLPTTKYLIITLLASFISILHLNQVSTFLYFNF